jgi:hypothetical protein
MSVPSCVQAVQEKNENVKKSNGVKVLVMVCMAILGACLGIQLFCILAIFNSGSSKKTLYFHTNRYIIVVELRVYSCPGR